MKRKIINELKYYRYLLIEYKKNQISNYLDNQIEKRIPTVIKQKKNKQKVLTLYK